MDVETLDSRSSVRGPHRAVPGIVVVFSGGGPAFQWGPLRDDGKIVIGRGEALGLMLDGRLSRSHAEIGFDGARWTVKDLASRNGTFVDGRAIQGEVTFETPPRLVRMADTIVLVLDDGWQAITARPMRDGNLVLGPGLRAALSEIETAAAAGHNVLVTGESGSGKELAARAYHAASRNKGGPLVTVNCATIPEGLAERLLFGAKKGAYSGAAADAEGYIQSAQGGVLFLDELGELDLQVQAKLLRALESHEVLPLGATQARKVDVRYCFATHRDLRRAVADGKFRADLFYRVGQSEVRLPPLRERLAEIPWLVVDEAKRAGEAIAVGAAFVEACMLRPWPGNVRELLGEVRRAAHSLASSASRVLNASHLSPRAGTAIEVAAAPPPSIASPSEEEKPAITRERLEAALREHAHATAVARALGIHRSHLYRLMKRHGIARRPEDEGEPEE